jgi:hypothetical protein
MIMMTMIPFLFEFQPTLSKLAGNLPGNYFQPWEISALGEGGGLPNLYIHMWFRPNIPRGRRV